ncbi:MAG TPA: hypothetical protein VFO60_01285 [Candidatus Dormibacteraeota bacterium]|nr:hypothetical protein [Candidatus Dormibacteraeota bacterium]
MAGIPARLVDMRISRRSLLTCGAIAAASAVAPLGGQMLTTAVAADPFRPVSRAEYARNAGSVFALHLDAATSVDAVLESVEDAPRARDPRTAPTRDHDAFTLVFRAPARVRARQGVYRLEHRVLGPAILLLVPGTRDRSGSTFVATINRL